MLTSRLESTDAFTFLVQVRGLRESYNWALNKYFKNVLLTMENATFPLFVSLNFCFNICYMCSWLLYREF